MQAPLMDKASETAEQCLRKQLCSTLPRARLLGLSGLSRHAATAAAAAASAAASSPACIAAATTAPGSPNLGLTAGFGPPASPAGDPERGSGLPREGGPACVLKRTCRMTFSLEPGHQRACAHVYPRLPYLAERGQGCRQGPARRAGGPLHCPARRAQPGAQSARGVLGRRQEQAGASGTGGRCGARGCLRRWRGAPAARRRPSAARALLRQAVPCLIEGSYWCVACLKTMQPCLVDMAIQCYCVQLLKEHRNVCGVHVKA